MRTRTCFVIVLLLAMSGAVSSAPQSDAAVRKALAPLYGRMRKAFLDRNIDAFMALFAPPGTARPGEKAADLQKVRAQVGINLVMVKKMTGVRIEMQTLTVKGDRAVVISKYAYQGIIESQPGKPVKVADKGVTRDTWAKTPKGWLLLDIETLQSNPTMDGKPMKEALKGGGAGAKGGGK